MASAEDGVGAAPRAVTFTVERIRIDEEAGQSFVSGADDEEEPAGYFIVEIDAAGATVEFLGEELSQRDGVHGVEIGESTLTFTLDPSSPIGAQMPSIGITSREAIGPAVRAALKRAFGDRVTSL